MAEFTFDIKMFTTITVSAESYEEAEGLIKDLDCCDTNFGAWPNGDPILGEATVDGEPDLIAINGEFV